MKKLLFIVSIVALALCNFYFIETDKDISKISLNDIVNIANAQTEEGEGWYYRQECFPCEPAPGQTGALFECWLWWGDPGDNEDCFNLDCGYGYC